MVATPFGVVGGELVGSGYKLFGTTYSVLSEVIYDTISYIIGEVIKWFKF